MLAEAEAGEDLLGLGFEAVAAQLVEAVVDVVVDVLGVQRLDGVVGVPGLDDAAELGVFGGDGGGQLEDGLVAGGGVFLRQIADGDAAFAGDVAGVGRIPAPRMMEKSVVLPAPFGPTRPMRSSRLTCKRGVGEQDAFAVGLADAGQSQHEPPV